MPDTLHFHQLLFNSYVKKFNLSKNYLNSATGLSINLFNGTILYFASMNISDTKFQILLLFICIFIYLILYLVLMKYKILSDKE